MHSPHNSCRSCGASLTGKFCASCGEKVIDPGKDFAIKKFTEQVIDGFTHFDTKIAHTFKALFFKPGLLTRNYLHGIRVKFMKPVQLFLVASVIFYFFMPNSASFYATFDELNEGFHKNGFSLSNPFKYDINRTLVLKAGKGLPETSSKDEIRQKANTLYATGIEKAAGRSKTMLFLVLPFWALLLWALFYRTQPFYVPHLIFTLHTISFFLLLDLIFLLFYFKIIGLQLVNNRTHLLPFFLLLLWYIIAAIKKTYKVSWLQSSGKGLLVFLFLLLLLLLYRVLITTWVFSAL